MKKYPPGFTPVSFKKLGRTFLLIGTVVIVMKGVREVAGGFVISDKLFFVAGAIFLSGAYMFFVVDEE